MTDSADQLQQAATRLAREVSGEVYLDRYRRALYSTDASLYQIVPRGVIVPRTRDDVRCVHQIAAELGVPIIPRGSGTSLSGQTVGAGLVIDFSKYLNRIVQLDPERCVARVEPGVVLDQLNAAAGKYGLQFGPDVATSNRANIGGMVGNNSAGARSILHGKTVDHVVEMEVLLSDASSSRLGPLTADALAARQRGTSLDAHIHREVQRIVAENRAEIVSRFPRILRRVSGYNLDALLPESRDWYPLPSSVRLVRQREAQRYGPADFNLARLVVGSEGTLATMTEAVLHLVPVPRHRGILVLHFESLDDACASLAATLELQPSAVEFFDRMILTLAAASLEYRNYLDFVVGQPESLIIVEFSSDDAADVRRRIDELSRRLQGQPGLYHVLPALEPQLRDHIWACRKAALPLLMGIPGRRKPIAFVEDTAVDPARLPEYVRRFREIVHRHGTDGAFYGHASVGCLHIRPLIDAADPDDLQRMRAILDEVSDLVLQFGGAMSGEHGDGLARSFLNEKLFGPRIYQAFRQVKAAFDPRNLMNPGKIVDAPGPTENLRQGPHYRTLEVATALDWSRQGGFARAVELCNGSGVCRKTRTGTMCPSFMATLDEEHSTRGRANALRLVLSGVLPPEELTGERLRQTYDLCLQCKGCKAECPSNVDVAKMKAEFLYQYHQRHGVPLGTRAMAHVARWNRRAARWAPLSNWLLRLPGMGWLQEKLLGIDRRRPLPWFHRRHFRRWFARRTPARPVAGPRPRVVLLDDCLTSYCEPAVNQAAVELLEHAGYEVVLAGLECCGRAAISKGLLDEAKTLAAANVARLADEARRGTPIVGCEPSCILTLADDYLDLVPGDDTRLVASRAQMIDTFLDAAMQAPSTEPDGPDLPSALHRALRAPRAAMPTRVLLHAHCHQKALVGTAATRRLLQCVPGADVTLIDSGCCGMAGSFGYEHYELSMQIGQRVLFPAVREAADAVVVAPGFSCRHQIAHGTGRQALHPVQYLRQFLLPPEGGSPGQNR
jgi:FAD/FMN-containing dehydrogenase/Fe-S oxidoreductase